MSPLFRAALAALSLAAVIALPATAYAAPSTKAPTKVAIIVGPVGSLTPTYLALAEAAAGAAQARGAVVARAYSPNATPANVLAAVEDANVIIYFGHGYGHPSPYGGLNTAKQNGWALQGPRAHGTHGDGPGLVQYLGEDWIAANARPAPGFVMIYSNTCYAPGASEPGHALASASTAAQRVAYYSRKVFAMGGSAYFATDFDRGAADLVGRLLAAPAATFGTAFASDHRYAPWALTSQPHPFSAGQSIWLHRTKYTDGPPNYWYAFAGNPALSPLRAWDRSVPTVSLLAPTSGSEGVGVSPTIRLRFSEPVTGVAADAVTLRDGTGAVVPASVTYDAESLTAMLKPTAPLAHSTRYTVSVTDAVRDAAARALKGIAWSFATRLDADPITAPLSVVLERGRHELLRLAPDGSVAETRELEVVDRRWIVADRRARLIDRAGSWLHLTDSTLGSWWIAESPVARVLGSVEEASLADGTTVTLPPGEHAVHGFAAAGPTVIDGRALSASEPVRVDRRRVFDGRTFLRLADAALAGGWVEVDPAAAPTDHATRRLLATEPRPAPAQIVLASGARPAFLFDADGRVLAERPLGGDDVRTAGLVTTETWVVGGARFAVIADGELAGWAVPEIGVLTTLPMSLEPASVD